MRGYEVRGRDGIDSLHLIEMPEPDAGPGQVVVEMQAASLNFRDHGILRGGYLRNDRNPVVPLSDGTGVVVAVGEGVDRFKPGDRVVASFVQDWIDGPANDAVLRSSLGGGVDGVLVERRAFAEHALVPISDELTPVEASCFPCAGVTAWQALFEHRELTGSDTVLLLGTGGVSIFALQLATSVGATVIQTSSSDEKLDQASQLGARHLVNYRTNPKWDEEVRSLTGGRGVDFVVEVGGPGTLAKSMAATAVGGQIALIGVLDDPAGAVHPLPAMFNLQAIQGIYVGSRRMLEKTLTHFEKRRLRPIVDRTFPFDQAADAYRYLRSQQHVGKVVIEF